MEYTLTGDFTQTGTMKLQVISLTQGSLISLEGAKDSTNTLGSDGEALISNASGEVVWQDISTLPL